MNQDPFPRMTKLTDNGFFVGYVPAVAPQLLLVLVILWDWVLRLGQLLFIWTQAPQAP